MPIPRCPGLQCIMRTVGTHTKSRLAPFEAALAAPPFTYEISRDLSEGSNVTELISASGRSAGAVGPTITEVPKQTQLLPIGG